jgi:hypothetical protein
MNAKAGTAPVLANDVFPEQQSPPPALPLPAVVHVWAGDQDGKEFHF